MPTETTDLQRINILVIALREIDAAGPTKEPDVADWNGNADDQYENGLDRANYFKAEIARKALKQFGGCQCKACQELDGHFHFSDCAVHNEPAMPNQPCDCEAMP